MNFWDSSAIVPLLVEDPTSASVRVILSDDPQLTYWWTSPVECRSALWRKVREEAIAPDQCFVALDRLQHVLTVGDLIHPLEIVRERAFRLLAVHPLRAADALQLAAALQWAGDRPEGAGFVVYDRHLAEAARREGFTILGWEG